MEAGARLRLYTLDFGPPYNAELAVARHILRHCWDYEDVFWALRISLRDVKNWSAEKLLPEDAQYGRTYSGKFFALKVNDDTRFPAIAGTFTVENGPTYQVKAADKAMLNRLAALDKKKCILAGKVRNGGKYLLVSSVIEAAGAPVERRKRGGL